MTTLAETLKAKTDDDGCKRGLVCRSPGYPFLQGAGQLAAIRRIKKDG